MEFTAKDVRNAIVLIHSDMVDFSEKKIAFRSSPLFGIGEDSLIMDLARAHFEERLKQSPLGDDYVVNEYLFDDYFTHQHLGNGEDFDSKMIVGAVNWLYEYSDRAFFDDVLARVDTDKTNNLMHVDNMLWELAGEELYDNVEMNIQTYLFSDKENKKEAFNKADLIFGVHGDVKHYLPDFLLSEKEDEFVTQYLKEHNWSEGLSSEIRKIVSEMRKG